MVLEYTPFTIF